MITRVLDEGLLLLLWTVGVLIQFIHDSTETDFNFRRMNIRAKKTTLFVFCARVCPFTNLPIHSAVLQFKILMMLEFLIHLIISE